MEQNKEKENSNLIVLTVIGIATLLIALIGATFSYFIATANNNNAQKIEVSSGAAVGLVYSAPTAILATNILPGDVIAPSTFTVTNNDLGNSSTMVFKYDLALKIDSNTFVKVTNADAVAAGTGGDQLIMNISASRSGQGYDNSGASKTSTLELSTPKTINLTDGHTLYSSENTNGAAVNSTIPLVNQQIIYIGETHSYKVGLNFYDYNYDQTINSNKIFIGHIEISNVNGSTAF